MEDLTANFTLLQPCLLPPEQISGMVE